MEKPTPPERTRFRPQLLRCHGRILPSGMTLLEMTVVILVLIGLVSVLFFGALAWKRGTDRAMCIMQIQNVQKGVRSYANLYGYAEGDTAPNLQSQIIGVGKYLEFTPRCPASGIYAFGAAFGNETVPPIGQLYMECSLAQSSDHVPLGPAEW